MTLAAPRAGSPERLASTGMSPANRAQINTSPATVCDHGAVQYFDRFYAHHVASRHDEPSRRAAYAESEEPAAPPTEKSTNRLDQPADE